MIITNKKTNYNLLPTSIDEEISQNIRVILSTYKGTVPLNRELGIDTLFVDTPSNVGLVKAKILIAQAIQEFEPRVEVTSVTIVKDVESAIDGEFKIEVEVNILDEYK